MTEQKKTGQIIPVRAKGAICILIFINPTSGSGRQLFSRQRKANIAWRKPIRKCIKLNDDYVMM